MIRIQNGKLPLKFIIKINDAAQVDYSRLNVIMLVLTILAKLIWF